METTERVNRTNSQWSNLFRIAGISAVLMVAFILIQITVLILYPPPASVIGWFGLFDSNKIIGLIDMDLLLMIDQVLMGFIFLALYIALRPTNPSYMTIALALGLGGIAAYFASTTAFEMLSLSNQYANATTQEEKSILLTSGKVMMTTWQGTAFDAGYVMEGATFLIMAIVMLQGSVFTRATAIVGVVLGILSLIPPTVSILGMFFALGSLIPLVIWNILIAKRFFKLSHLKE